MNDTQTSEKYFIKFKELTREKLGEEEYRKKTEQELFDSFHALITLVGVVYKPIYLEKNGLKET